MERGPGTGRARRWAEACGLRESGSCSQPAGAVILALLPRGGMLLESSDLLYEVLSPGIGLERSNEKAKPLTKEVRKTQSREM